MADSRSDVQMVVPPCPACGEALFLAHDNHGQMKICVCKACSVTMTIPNEAWLRMTARAESAAANR